MRGLWETLGYERVVDDVLRHLVEQPGIVVLEGPPGVGKSWLARGLGAFWRDGGGATIVAEGDTARSEFALHPFAFSLDELGPGWSGLSAGVTSAASTAAVGPSKAIASVLQAFAAARRGRRPRKAIFLGDREQKILFDIERLARRRPVLLIADNIHWWDRESLGMLRSLLEAPLRSGFPFLADLRVLAVQTIVPYQAIAHPDQHRALMDQHRVQTVELGRVTNDRFAEVLQAVGAGALPTKPVADAVYVLSGGHLALASRAAARLAAGDADTFLAASATNEFVRSIITDRIAAFGELGREALFTLQIGAVLGLAFHRNELQCASELPARDLARVLRHCRDEQMLDLASDRCRFVHDLYRQVFLDLSRGDLIAIHERLSECFRQLRPSEYDLRSLNAIHADDRDDAARLGTLAALQRVRNGHAWSELPPDVVAVMTACGQLPVVDRFRAAQHCLQNYEFVGCLQALDGLPHDIHASIAAEADYIRAMCRMSMRSEVERRAGRSILEAWSGYERDEPEIGLRLARLLLYGYAHVHDKEPGRQLEVRVRRALGERVAIDPGAEDELYTLDRCAGGLYQTDVTLIRYREAMQHFAPDEGSSVVRRPLEYYRCLVNYGAALMGHGRHDEANRIHELALRLVADYADGTFPRLDYLHANAILSNFRRGAVHADEAVRRQQDLIEDHGIPSDPYYAQNALAVYMMHAGRSDDAAAILRELRARVETRLEEPESSMVYMAAANLCAVERIASLGAGRWLEEWDRLESVLQTVAYVETPVYLRRHRLLREVFTHTDAITAVEFDEFPIRTSPDEFGPLWGSYGRGFIMYEVEFWRDN